MKCENLDYGEVYFLLVVLMREMSYCQSKSFASTSLLLNCQNDDMFSLYMSKL